jgi:hypothetical protein
MPVTAQSADGVLHEFPDGTDQSVIDRAMKKYASESPAATNTQAAPPQPDGPSLPIRFGANVWTGLASVPGLPVELGGLITNGIEWASGDKKRTVVEKDPVLGRWGAKGWVDWANKNFDLPGQYLPPAQTGLERIADKAGLFAGGGMVAGPAGMIPTAVSLAGSEAGRVLDKAGVTGGYGEIGGALVAPLASAVVPGVLKGALQGGARAQQNAAKLVRDFESVGSMPSAGQITPGWVANGTESLASKMPGGIGRMRKFYEAQRDQIGTKLSDIADRISAGATPERAGRAISSGIDNFMFTARQRAEGMFNKLDAFLPGQTRVSISNTTGALKSLTNPVPGSPNISTQLANPKIARIAQAIVSDDQSGTLSFESLKQLRSAIGREAFSSDMLIDAAPRAQMKALYGALTEDMRQAATRAGPGAELAFKRANQYYSALNQRVDDFLNGLSRKAEPEKIFAAIQSNTREGGQMVTAVMRSLSQHERRAVTSAVLQKLGRATAGNQDAAGEVFSSDVFLTNWNKLTPRAKFSLFSSEPGLSQSLDAIASAANAIRKSQRVLANPSGTGQVVTSAAAVSSAGIGLFTNPWVTASVGGLFLIGNGAARLMTSPAFVRWLASSAKSRSADIPSMLGRLPAIAQQDPSIRDDLAEYVRVVNDRLKAQEGGQ